MKKYRCNPIKVTSCEIENFLVDCYLDPEIDSSYFEWPTKNEPKCQLVVGCKDKVWPEIVDGLLHELGESLLYNLRLAYHNDNAVDVGSAGRTFILNHDEFSEIITKLSSVFCALEKYYLKKFREQNYLKKKK